MIVKTCLLHYTRWTALSLYAIVELAGVVVGRESVSTGKLLAHVQSDHHS